MPSHRCGRALAVCFVTVAAACQMGAASARTRIASTPSVVEEIPRSEIDSARVRVVSAYELIRRLRPAMLISRDSRMTASRPDLPFGETPDIKVYVDGLYVGNLQVLSSISAREVVSIRRMSGATAGAQYGEGLTAGVIVITTSASRR